MIDLKGKSALVTGAAHGIGEAIANLFEEAGARVLRVDIESTDEDWCCRADVRSADQAGDAVRRLVGKAGAIDILVNNAAWTGPGHALLEAGDDEWRNAFEVNLLGARNFARAALGFMVPRKRGSIINIASVQAIAAARDSAAYTTTKAGLIGFTRSIAYDYGPHGIRANVICPGAIRTRISPPEGSELHARQIAKTFLGRIGSTADVANAALYLASDVSAYVTGSVLPVDGGWSAM